MIWGFCSSASLKTVSKLIGICLGFFSAIAELLLDNLAWAKSELTSVLLTSLRLFISCVLGAIFLEATFISFGTGIGFSLRICGFIQPALRSDKLPAHAIKDQKLNRFLPPTFRL